MMAVKKAKPKGAAAKSSAAPKAAAKTAKKPAAKKTAPKKPTVKAAAPKKPAPKKPAVKVEAPKKAAPRAAVKIAPSLPAQPPPAPPVPTPARALQPKPAAVAPPPPKPVAPPPPPKPKPAPPRQEQKPEPPPEPVLKPLKLRVPLTVKELGEKLAVSPSEIIKHLLGMKIFATINQLVTEETVEKILKKYGYQFEKMPTLEEEITAEQEEVDPAKLIPRPPVVTLMGHVDHGKTSLLDQIRKTRVVEGEAGGITQHIGAYRVNLPKGTITFLDTPGHEAFTAMRARGANATDVVIIVVAADDGIMPQTVEAIDHAKAAEATIVVAINKMDKPSANPDKVKKQLTEYELTPEDWGGKTIVVPVSAKSGEGIDQMLDMILLEAELLELKADPTKQARGIVLEGELTKGGGPIAHVLVQNGTLRVGDVFVMGSSWGKVRAMHDARGHRIKEAGPSTPVELMGLSSVPVAGDTFMLVPDERKARDVVMRRQEELKKPEGVRRAVSLEEFHAQLQAGKVKNLNLIVKADVQGSVEALKDSLAKITSKEANFKLLHVGVGAVNESDILLAEASSAVVIGFHVQSTPEAETLAKEEKVDVRFYRVIYEAVADIKAALEGLLEPRLVERVSGRAKVLQAFKLTKAGTIAGCQVLKGKVVRNGIGRVFRGEEKIAEGKLTSLKRFKDDVREVSEGYQCGISVAGWNDIQPGDVIEAIEIEQVAQRL